MQQKMKARDDNISRRYIYKMYVCARRGNTYVACQCIAAADITVESDLIYAHFVMILNA